MFVVRCAALAALTFINAPMLGAQAAVAAVAAVGGRVLDAETRAPLSFVTVRLVELHRVDQTHADGSFRFRDLPAGRFTVLAQRIGYAPVEQVIEFRAGHDTTVELSLTAMPVTLSRTIVTGTARERRAADAVSPTTVLDGAALDRRLDGTLAATIAGQPGVSATSMGPATARPVLRGLSGDRVLVLEDGVRPGDLSTTSADHAVAVDALTIRRVEVVRGPMSLLYGSSALGGVINAVREEVPSSIPDGVHGTVSTQASSVNDGLSIGGEVRAPWRGLAWRAEGSVRHAQDLRTPDGRLTNTDLQSAGGSVGVSRVGERGYAGVSYRGFTNAYGLPGGFVGAHPGGVNIDMRRHAVRAELDHHFEGRVIEAVKASVGFTDYSHEERTRSGNIGTRFAQQMLAGEVVASLTPVGPFANGAVGGRVQYRDITTGGALRTPSTEDWTAGLFLVEELVRGAWRWQGGVRGDVARFMPRERTTVRILDEDIPTAPRTFAAVSGSLGVLWTVREDLRIGGNVSRSFRVPDFNELYSDGPHLAAYSYDVGNPRLNAETGLGVDLFARLERDRLQGEIALFSNTFDQYIFPRNTGELGRVGERWKFQFAGRDARLTGGEVSAAWTLARALVVEGSAAYVQGAVLGSRDTIAGIDGAPDVLSSRALPLVPPLNGRVGARWDRPRWFVGGGVRGAATQDRLGDFETETAGYGVVDMQAGVRLLLGDRLHAITLRVDNAFDRSFRDHLSRTKAIIPEAGRNVSLLYRILF
jgi:iron complex outermembrane receptor protein